MSSVPAAHAATPLEEARSGLDACVHCGFCLQSCPTYLALEDENDSPRGRVLLMRGLLEGEFAASDETFNRHISRCLGCRACETACPSGVPYGELLEATRATVAEVRPLPAVARLILWVFERRAVLALALFAARTLRWSHVSRVLARLPGRMGFAFAMLESTRPAAAAKPGAPPKPSSETGRVAMLEGCVMRGLFAHTNAATRRVLAVNGREVVEVADQRCCGALHAHAGDLDGARRLARANIDAFERAGVEAIAVNAAGCGAMMKDYGHLLRHDPEYGERAKVVSRRVRDISELLAEAGPRPGRHADSRRVAYDPPCHLLHAQRVSQQPLAVLNAVPGLALTPLAGAEQCCGAAGIYNLLEPAVSNAVLDTKLAHVAESKADLVATGNPGCLMQIGAGLLRAGSPARTIHPVELLDRAYQGHS